MSLMRSACAGGGLATTGEQRPSRQNSQAAMIRHGAHGQYGAKPELKKRASQPMRFELSMTPLPE